MHDRACACLHHRGTAGDGMRGRRRDRRRSLARCRLRHGSHPARIYLQAHALGDVIRSQAIPFAKFSDTYVEFIGRSRPPYRCHGPDSGSACPRPPPNGPAAGIISFWPSWRVPPADISFAWAISEGSTWYRLAIAESVSLGSTLWRRQLTHFSGGIAAISA